MTAKDLGPLQRLSALGQSVWVDFLSRESIHGGHLQTLIDDYAVVGATSNPTILQKAMTAGSAYDDQLHELASEGLDVGATFWALAIRDIEDACDVFRPVWDATDGRRRVRVHRGRSAPRLRHARDLPRGDQAARRRSSAPTCS